MIWASGPNGDITYVSPEWHDLTGRAVVDALGSGWQAAVHPDDVAVIAAVWRDASAQRREFWTIFRFVRADGDAVWVLGGARPAHSPITDDFLGFLGSVSRVDLRAQLSAQGELEPFRSVDARPVLKPKTHLEMLADLSTLARSIADEAGYGDVLEAVNVLDVTLQARSAQGTRQAMSIM